ncbi:hypothetical protein ASZ90_017742 [hydrocarbon metagenome]|uniref:Uncharacterized protein n=1 Tax=hydrocarbon metagenome TaxID=938273 RepID=A0A0W8E8B4_9ZZZZ
MRSAAGSLILIDLKRHSLSLNSDKSCPRGDRRRGGIFYGVKLTVVI